MNINSNEYAANINTFRGMIEHRLAEISNSTSGSRIHQPLEYVLLSRGKMARSTLAMVITSVMGGDVREALSAACAVEMLHAASLILDDLPCMDDAMMRRSRPTCHRVYGESLTILTAMQLVSLAYENIITCVSANNGAHLHLLIPLLNEMHSAIGCDGLIGGQIEDLMSTRVNQTYDILPRIYEKKTASLFILASVSGAYIANASLVQVEAIRTFARHLGIAYQMLDDTFDQLHAGTALTDKDTGKDDMKCTFMQMTSNEFNSAAIGEILNYSRKELSSVISNHEQIYGYIDSWFNVLRI